MIVSRGRNVLRLFTKTRSLLSNTKQIHCTPTKWHGGVVYRSAPPDDKSEDKVVKFVSAFFWWWVLWHFFTEYEELSGPFIPNPSDWTDEELGIPPE